MHLFNSKAHIACLVGLAFMVTAFSSIMKVTHTNTDDAIDTPVQYVTEVDGVSDVPQFSLDAIPDDVLWLARCVYSETKRPDEQELVAWVVRNRVETNYRGRSGYRSVVLDPYQFSAFNRGSRKRRFYTHLDPYSNARGWVRTLKIAHDVYYSEAEERPFSITTRHFYSERSMRGRGAPGWSRGRAPVQLTGYEIDERRFRFYSGIS